MFKSLPTLLLMLTFGVTSSAEACRNAGGGGWKQQRGGGHYSHWQIPDAEARRLNPTSVSGESLMNGKGIYQANCLRCHGDYAMGDGPDAAGLAILPPNLRRAAHHHTDGALSWIIRTGREPMPSWKDELTDEQIWDLINYVRFELGGSIAHQRGGGHMAHQRGSGRMNQQHGGRQMSHQHGGGRMDHKQGGGCMNHQRGSGHMTQRQKGCSAQRQTEKGQCTMGGGRGAKRKQCEMQTALKGGESELEQIQDSD